jgi:type II secretory pathway component PulF
MVLFCPPSTSGHKRESISMLFDELAMCVKHDFPLDEALDRISRSKEASWTNKKHWKLIFYCLLAPVLFVTILYLINQYILLKSTPILEIFICILFFITLIFMTSILRFNRNFIHHVAYKLSGQIKKGKSLSEAMTVHKKFFSDFELGLVRVGEKSGNLDNCLKQLASYNRKFCTRNLSNYLAYPVILFLISCMMILFFSQTILPRLKDIFTLFGGELPYLSLSLLSFSELIRDKALIIMVIVFTFLYMIFRRKFLRSIFLNGSIELALGIIMFLSLFILSLIFGPKFHFITIYLMIILSACIFILLSLELIFDIIITGNAEKNKRMRIPLLHSLELFFQKSRIHSQFLFALGSLFDSGMTLPEALILAGEATANRKLQDQSELLALKVENGISFRKALSDSNMLDERIRISLGLASETSRLKENFIILSKDLENKAKVDNEIIIHFLRILIIILTGITGGIIVLSMYLPIFNIPHIVFTYTD